MSTEQHPTWDGNQTREAIEAYLNSDDGQRYQKLYSEGANAEDLRVFLRDAAHRLVCKTDRVQTWWQGILDCVGANHRHFLALAEPLCQLGKTPEDLYGVLARKFQVDALIQAYRCFGLGPSNGLAPGITDSRGWSDDEIRNKLEEVKKTLSWDNTTGSARKWWENFENENRTKANLVLRLAEELANRKATITEFFLAYVYSNTDNIQANLAYLDYTRLKKEDEKRKREAAAKALGNSLSTPTSPVSHREAGSSINTSELTFIRCRSCGKLVPAAAKKCRICESPLAESVTSTNSETTVTSAPSSKATHASDAPRWERFRSIIVEQLGVSPEEVTEGASFVEDFGADSLDIVELIMAMEEEYDLEVPDEVAETIHTVGDAFRYGISVIAKNY